jgi:hypothetical protein
VKKNRTRLAALGLAALAVTAIVGPGSAQAARVSEDAPGGLVPDEINNPFPTPNVSVPFVQEFRFKGKNVNKRQVLDVNVTVNGTGNGPGSNGGLTALLVAPKGEHAGIPLPGIGSAMSNLQFDDQSILRPCDPFLISRDDCNYLQGASPTSDIGTMTGELSSGHNPVFKGINPRGTWRLIWRDNDFGGANTVSTVLGETELELKTGRKFAKEGK